MLIQIETQSEIPIYIQLANQIIEGIVRGRMKSGDSLPSVRSLAADLGVNMHTVNKSYRELEKKGIIRIIPKSGAVISPSHLTEEQRERLEKEMKPLVAEALVLGMTENEIQKLIHSALEELKEE